MGAGYFWQELGLSTSEEAPCDYTGTKATEEFQSITGCSSIPLEQDGLIFPDFEPIYTAFNCLFCKTCNPRCQLQNS